MVIPGIDLDQGVELHVPLTVNINSWLPWFTVFSVYTNSHEGFITNSELFIFFSSQLSSLLSLSSLFFSFLLSRYHKVKGYHSTIVIAVSHPSITAGHEGKPSGKGTFFYNLQACFYTVCSKHLECSVAIYSALQGVLFVETAESKKFLEYYRS